MIWTLQDAKNRFSEVVEKANTEGPQKVTKHGKETVVIVAASDWNAYEGKRISIADFFLSSSLAGADLEFTRDTSAVRPVDV